jgi:transposase
MMVRLRVYGYASGVCSSRKMQMRRLEDAAFRYLSGDQHSDHATIAQFRKRHLEALSGLFAQALLLCSETGRAAYKMRKAIVERSSRRSSNSAVFAASA